MRVLVIALVVALSLPLAPLTLVGGAATESASLAGSVTSSTGQVLPNAAVQLRDLTTGTVSATVMSSSTGTFSFAAVAPGNYVVEVLNAAGQVVGISASISLPAGGTVTDVGVRATAASAAATTGGTSARTIVAVTAAAVAAGVVGIVAVGQGDASPTR